MAAKSAAETYLPQASIPPSRKDATSGPERCAPCHRADVDGRVDPRAAVPPADFACTRGCRKSTGAARMLLCDGCTGLAGIWSACPGPSQRSRKGTGSARKAKARMHWSLGQLRARVRWQLGWQDEGVLAAGPTV
ncbi:hypothetical protein KFL_005900100 [Klebsormidium nitens]|uniref:Uncharacterized protein n=1 Tax=Klebsormidium nitens TaxID=105231 RepID=A0A1Y1IH79_KLENI|nr:hypothetical protein KFL_005900100 [Klebsormidium nitens]|eukprot:GAQ90023.1 hypothetical protein KFL_005900100 [Klebsormidium nitens]